MIKVGISDYNTATRAVTDVIDLVTRHVTNITDAKLITQNMWMTDDKWYEPLIEGELDFVRDAWTITPWRQRVMNFSYPIYHSRPIITVHIPKGTTEVTLIRDLRN